MLQSAEPFSFRKSSSTEVFSFIFPESGFRGGAIVALSLPHINLIGHSVCGSSFACVCSGLVSDGWRGRVVTSA